MVHPERRKIRGSRIVSQALVLLLLAIALRVLVGLLAAEANAGADGECNLGGVK